MKYLNFALATLVAMAIHPCYGGNGGNEPAEEYEKGIRSSASLSPLESNLFGEQTDLYNGRLEFSVTDIDLPGNFNIPVRLTRTFSVNDRDGQFNDALLADWDLDLPNVSGVFAMDWHDQRCSGERKPPRVFSGTYFSASEYWDGNHANIPHGGEMLEPNPSTPKPSVGGPYYWVTSGFTHFSCLSSIGNGTGEGFLAITPDGTKYWFNWMAQTQEPMIYGYGYMHTSFSAARKRNTLYATRVEDRFGNWVVYNYTNAFDQPARLSSIASSDGRNIAISYRADGYIASATANGRTWTYHYTSDVSLGGSGGLAKVILPDASQWTIDFAGLRYVEIDLSDNFGRSCAYPGWPSTSEGIGLVTHPSGATATFEVAARLFGRSNVRKSCNYGPTNVESDDTALNARTYWIPSLVRKRIVGPGLADQEWNYALGSLGEDFVNVPGSWLDPSSPLCTSDACAGTSETIVTGPGGSWTRYTYGTSFQYNEHKLLKVERGTGPADIRRTESYSYELSTTGQTFPTPVGKTLQGDEGYVASFIHPIRSTVIVQDGVTFTQYVNAYDAHGNPANVTKSSSLGYSKNESLEYHNNPAKWVLNQVQREAVDGVEATRVEFWPDTSAIRTIWRFGKQQQEISYYADGTIAGIRDGNNHLTALSLWHRGIPRNIAYADGTSVSGSVDDNGWITSVVDQNGFSTGYGYDAMGRLAAIVYPSNDSTAWNTVTMTFQQVAVADRGLPAGHWRQSRYQGNRQTHTYFDGLWRPVMVLDYDSADGNIQSQLVKRYDANGRLAFQSYPTRHVTDFQQALAGTWTNYDALDRVVLVRQDSELGPLDTTTEYLAGFQKRTTNPRGYQTTSGFQVFDAPSYDAPAWIARDAGAGNDQAIQIARDAFGKPKQLRQSGYAAGVLSDRSRYYAYDGYQQLCKVIEPETGSTVMAYDGAGNLSWSATGHSLPDPDNCNSAEGYSGGRRVDRTYDARNRLKTLAFPDGRGNQIWDYAPDGLPSQITTYNDAGNAAPVVNAYSYNKRRLLTGESIGQPGWYNWGIGYGYDANGSLATHTYPTGLAVNYAPNALGQATSVTDSSGRTHASGVSYHPDGAISQFSYGNGIVYTMQQNARQMPSSASSSGVVGYDYAYDPNGNVTYIGDQVQGGNYSRWMSYDGLDRLTDAGSASFGGDHWHRYTYDALNNLTSWKLPGVKDYASYIYDASNRLTLIQNSAGAGIVGLGYDPQGNLQNKNGQIYTFDYGNRLREATGLEWYRYDGQGRRVMNWRATEQGVLSQYGQTGKLLYDENYRASARKASEYIYLAGALISTRERNIDNNAWSFKFQHTDALGSPVAVTDDLGQVIDRTAWEPYGSGIGKPAYDGIGFTGHVADGATGLVYMQQRYYDPQIGRFLSVDPVTANPRDGSNFNRYWYAGNNPYKFVDPQGRDIVCVRSKCTVNPDGADLPSIDFPRPEGFPDRIDESTLTHHEYRVETTARRTGDNTYRDRINDALVRNGTPIADRAATPSGTRIDVNAQGAISRFTGRDTVISYRVDLGNGRHAVLNVTTADHAGRHGVVLRVTQSRGDLHTVVSYGEGNSLAQALFDPRNANASAVWEESAKEIIKEADDSH